LSHEELLSHDELLSHEELLSHDELLSHEELLSMVPPQASDETPKLKVAVAASASAPVTILRVVLCIGESFT
jgi:hypothetical protein